jgi:hypothetical protein
VKHGHNVALVPQSLGVTLLDDSETEIAGLTFFGGTLWADGPLVRGLGTPLRETGEQMKSPRCQLAPWA